METRKIAAILAADVVGFSRMASADEDRTLARLRALRADLIDPTVASQNGRVFKRTGDGALVEFRSVVEAVRCAVTIQNAMIERNASLPSDQRIDFRIGIHLGDIVEESDGDFMGDGVNIAARLEGVAEPGTICLSEDAYRQVKGRLDLAVTDLGPTALKNIAEPVRAYSLHVGRPAIARPVTRARMPEAKKPSILAPLFAGIVALIIIVGGIGYALIGNRLAPVVASRLPPAHLSIVVLPFTNLSNDPAQDYFTDGITENLTTDLSRIRDSFVIARNTAFTYKGRATDAKAIGKELGVRYVLEGSVQRDQERVRVNAQLIDAETGAQLWADRFEDDVPDLFKLQDEVVARIANSLQFELVNAEAEKSARSQNPDAIDLVMRAGALLLRAQGSRQVELAPQARVLYQQALTRDPNDSSALAGEAFTYWIEYSLGAKDPSADYDAKIIGGADRALETDRQNILAYEVKAGYLALIGRQADALRVARDGLIVVPNSAFLLAVRSIAETYSKQFDEAKTDIAHAMRLSPRDPGMSWWRNLAADAELCLGHLDATIDLSKASIEGGNRSFFSYLNLASASALRA